MDDIYIYQYSVLRKCYCIRGRHKFKGIKKDFPFEFSDLDNRHYLEIQHFKKNNIWTSRIRCFCNICIYRGTNNIF